MERLGKALKDITRRQIQLLSIIRTIEQNKNQILSTGRLMDFSEFNENVSKLIEENLRLEKERQKLISDFSRECGGNNAESMSFWEIIQSVENDKLKQELQSIYEELKLIVLDIKYITKINQEFIDIAIQVIDLSLGQGELSSKDIDYTRSTQIGNERPLLINRII